MDKTRKIIIFSLTRTGCIEYTVELLRAFKPYNPILYVNTQTKDSFENTANSIKTYTNIFSFIYTSILFSFKIKKIIKNLKKEYGSITIYLPSFHFWNYHICKQAKKERIPCFVTVHDYKTHLGEKNKFVEWTQKLTMKLASSVVFLSNSEIEKAKANNFPTNKLLHLPHPLFKSSTLNTLPHNKKPSLLFLGRIKKYKGIDILLEAIKDLEIEKLTIAGSGNIPQTQDLRISILNSYIEENDLNNLLCTHEILVIPYLDASQSGILSLGLSKNIVMIVSKHPGLLEQASDTSCFWIEPNAQSIQQAVKSLVNDADLYNKIKVNSNSERIKFEEKWDKTFENLLTKISSN